MSEDPNLDDRLEALGAALRSRPTVTDRVMDEVRRSVADGSSRERPRFARPSTRGTRGLLMGRQRLFTTAAGTIATICAGLLIVITMFPSPSVGWADVTKAIHSQKWIRGTATYGNGEKGTMWMSLEHEIWAYKLGGSSYFYDGSERVKYELRDRETSITKLPLGEDDAQRVLSMNALAQDKSAVGHWLFGTEKIVSQTRREVVEAGKTWVEFQMTLYRGEMNQATLRIDPKTKLPVYLLLASPTNPKTSIKWQFDYPASGPADIYALGVPRGTKIDDRMPTTNALAVLRAMARSREAIGDFRLLIGEYPSQFSLGSVVLRKGDRWRVDSYWYQGNGDLAAAPPRGQDWAVWFEIKLNGCLPAPTLICDGKTVWENSSSLLTGKPQWKVSAHTGPQDLMSSDSNLPRAGNVKIAWLLFPDLSPKPGWGFEFDPQPADAPGCVLIKRSVKTTSVEPTVGHEWYYVDPAKGHAVVRAELFNLPRDTPSDPKSSRMRQTILMEGFQQTKQGFWYPAVVHDTRPGSDQPATPPRTTTIHYYFDFAADLPDSRFTIVDGEAAKQP